MLGTYAADQDVFELSGGTTTAAEDPGGGGSGSREILATPGADRAWAARGGNAPNE